MNISKKLKIALRNILMSCGAVATDKAELLYDGELGVGLEVYVDAGGEVIPAEDGDYTCEDGQIIVVKDGKIAEIKPVEPEEAEEPKNEEEQMAEDTPIDEPATDPVEEPVEDETEEVSVEDRLATLEGRIADLTSALETILNNIAAFETRIAEVEAKVAKVESEPATDPIDDNKTEEEQAHTRAYYLRKNQ